MFKENVLVSNVMSVDTLSSLATMNDATVMQQQVSTKAKPTPHCAHSQLVQNRQDSLSSSLGGAAMEVTTGCRDVL